MPDDRAGHRVGAPHVLAVESHRLLHGSERHDLHQQHSLVISNRSKTRLSGTAAFQWHGRVTWGVHEAAAGAHLQQVVLHYVADDAKLVKVAAAPLSAKRLLQYQSLPDAMKTRHRFLQLFCQQKGLGTPPSPA